MDKTLSHPTESGYYWAKWWYGVAPIREIVMYNVDDDIVSAIGSSKEYKVDDFTEYEKLEAPKELTDE